MLVGQSSYAHTLGQTIRVTELSLLKAVLVSESDKYMMDKMQNILEQPLRFKSSIWFVGHFPTHL